MKHIHCALKMFCFVLATTFISQAYAQTYPNEVWKSGSTYYWRINSSQAGSSSSLSTAINSCMGSGREVHVTTSGTLTGTLNVPGTNVKLYCHGNTFTCNFTGSGILNGHNGFEIYDLTLRNVVGGYGIRSSAASNLRFVNVRAIDIAWIGMRIDSRSSNPWNYTITNLYMKDCHFENCGSHGLETYSIDGITIEGTITARNCGECGVLFNQSRNGTVGTVNAYNCSWGGGYAGLRYANACNNITTNRLIADHCGRGFFVVQSGPTVNCHLNNAEIRECSNIGIWIENGTNCSVKAGCCTSGVSVSGSGSYANVSSTCPTGAPSSRSAFSTIQAETYNSMLGVQTETCSEGGLNVSHIENSDWIRFAGVNFGTGATGVSVRVASNTAGGTVKFRIDAAGGTQIASLNVTNSGGWQTWKTMTASVSGVSGVHDLYLSFSGGTGYLFNLNHFVFTGGSARLAVSDEAEQESVTENSVQLSPNPAADVLNVETTQQLDKDARVLIYDNMGRQVLGSKLSGSRTTLGVGGFSPGMYILKLSNGREIVTKKFLKK